MAETNLKAVSQVGSFPTVSPTVRITDASELAKVAVKGASSTNLATQLAAITPGHSTMRGTVLIGSVRPGEWLYIGPLDAVGAAVADLDLAGHTAVTDVTHARSAVRITGSSAADLLARCCSLDFADAMFPDEATATGSVASVRCDIVRNDLEMENSYMLVFDRSYSEYLTRILNELVQEFAG